MFTFQGLRGIINEFRSATLDLQALSSRSGQGLVDRLELPWTYLWNASLLPKPKDWRRRPIDIVGFMQTYAAPSYTPPEDLTQFLRTGSKPIYVGFGSIPVEESKGMTAAIFAAAKRANVRICLSSGWAKLGADVETPENVFILGDVPHDWLFLHMAAAVHHGGSGTTCASLKASLPTLIVPFFGEQGSCDLPR
jgi:sterol 3beta-glucosyltransferase